MHAVTKEAIRADLLRMIRDLRDDWDWSGEITDDTGLFRQLGFESIDVVALGSTLEEHFNETLPFADFLTKAKERDVHDITVGDLLAFLVESLSPSSVARTA
jgi:acyl carrier protein